MRWVVVELQEQAAQDGVERGGEQWGNDGSSQEPDNEGVPLPGPQNPGGCPRVCAHRMNEVSGGEWRRAGAEEDLAGAEVDEYQRELNGKAEVVGDLRGNEVQSSKEGDTERKQCRGAHNGVDSDDRTYGKRPGEAAGRGTRS